MIIAHSKVTAQGQISVPAELRRKLGIGPGSVLEWEEQGELVLVRRAGRYSSQEIHEVLFGGKAPVPRSVAAMKEGVRRYIRKRHARH